MKTIFALAALAVLGVASAAQADEASCAALAGKAFPASALTFPSSGATVTTAKWVGRAGGNYCEVRGAIAPLDPKATRTLFAVNLPRGWNRKLVQFGGGGLNGSLVEATGLLRDDPPGAQPLSRGYATLGTDGGHPNAQPEIGVFLLNDEAVVNHAYGANKNGLDIARLLIAAYYGEPARRTFFYGGSEGGRQSMAAVQMFPQDYDGVVANVPQLNLVGYFTAKYHAWQQTLDGGWINKAKLKVLQDATAAACDEADGLKDGVISRYRGCAARFSFAPIRCPQGADSGDSCLSDKQIAAVRAVRGDYSFPYPLKNGWRRYPGLSVGGEAQVGALNPWIMIDDKPSPMSPGTEISSVQFVRFAIAQDSDFRGPLDLNRYRDRIQALSKILDQNSPDLSAFQKRGGKLILKANTADYAVSPEGVFAYVESVRRKMGGKAVDGFMRLYVNPGVNHAGSGVQADGSKIPDKVDLLAALDAWVQRDVAPGDLTVTSYEGAKPVASRPLCRFPNYPRYGGSGDAASAASFTCTPF